MRLAGTKLAANHQYRGFGDQLYDLSGQRPSLDLNFSSTKSLVDATTGQNLVTFTRASSGTYVDSQGVIRTATTNEARFDHNPTTGESLGLLVEEQRTNLNLYSEDFGNAIYTLTAATVSTNTAVAPDGTTTADTVNSSGTAIVSQSFTKAASAVTYTGSLFVKGNATDFSLTIDDGATVNRGRARFNLSTGTLGAVTNDGTFTGTTATIAPFPNGWYRLTVTTTTNTLTTARLRSFWSGTGTSTDFWGAQLETGAFATSYIPTTTAAVTRSADVASITGSNFSSWYRQDEGTVFAEYRTPAFGTRGIAGFNDTTANERIALLTSGTDPKLIAVDGGVTQADINGGTIAAGVMTKSAGAYAINDFAFAHAGGTAVTDTSGTLPTITRLLVGADQAGNYQNGRIRRLTYFPTRLANEVLQRITQ